MKLLLKIDEVLEILTGIVLLPIVFLITALVIILLLCFPLFGPLFLAMILADWIDRNKYNFDKQTKEVIEVPFVLIAVLLYFLHLIFLLSIIHFQVLNGL